MSVLILDINRRTVQHDYASDECFVESRGQYDERVLEQGVLNNAELTVTVGLVEWLNPVLTSKNIKL